MTPEDLLWAAFEKADNCCADRELDVIDTGGHFESFRMSQVVDALRELLTVRSVEELDALPAEAIIKTEGGSVACRFYDGIHGVVFGDDRPFVWSRLETELPGVILWHPDWGTP